MAIYAITGRPRHGKTYYLATIICDMIKHGERVYSNIKINLGEGALKKVHCDCELKAINENELPKYENGKKHYEECIIGDIYNPKDIANPNKILFYWRNIHEWNHMTNGNIIADEGTRYFNPRQWAMLSEDTEIKLQQHGKEDLDIYTTTQHYTRLDLTLRLLVEKFYIVRTTWGNPDNKKPFLGLKRFKITEVELEDIEDWYQMQKRPELELDIPTHTFGKWFRKKYAKVYDTRQAVGRSESMPLVHKIRTCPICGKKEIKHV